MHFHELPRHYHWVHHQGQAFLAPRPPYPGGAEGGACRPFSKWWVPPDGTPPQGGGGGGQECIGGFEGKGYIPFLPLYFLCVGQSVSGCVPLELSPPPPTLLG